MHTTVIQEWFCAFHINKFGDCSTFPGVFLQLLCTFSMYIHVHEQLVVPVTQPSVQPVFSVLKTALSSSGSVCLLALTVAGSVHIIHSRGLCSHVAATLFVANSFIDRQEKEVFQHSSFVPSALTLAGRLCWWTLLKSMDLFICVQTFTSPTCHMYSLW